MIIRHDPASRTVQVGERDFLNLSEARRAIIDLKRAYARLQSQIKTEALKAEVRKTTEKSLAKAGRLAGAGGGKLIEFSGGEK